MLPGQRLIICHNLSFVFECFCKLSKDNTVWLILSFQGSFISFHQKLLFYFYFKHLENLNKGQHGLNHTVWFSDVYSGYRNSAMYRKTLKSTGPLTRNGLIHIVHLGKFDQFLLKAYSSIYVEFCNVSHKFRLRDYGLDHIVHFRF